MRKCCFGILLACLAVASLGAAQTQTGTITGAAADEQGARMPGVTVSIASPALIGGARTAVTNQTGSYQFSQLPPGLYTVTFELSGFNTLRMEAIDVRVAFVSTVNARMQVAGVEETITVTGESPVVDVKSSVAATNIDKDLFETVPSGNNPFTMAAFVPGMVTGRLDVGGNEGAQQYALEIFGSDPDQKTFSVDGLKVNWPGGAGGATMQYYDFAMYEEYNFQTSSTSAEVDVSGVYMNMVTKSGGNDFSSDNAFYYENDSLQADNIDADLEAQGIQQGNPIDIAYDWNSTLGGPIVTDKAWFFGSIRWWRLDQFQTGAVNPDGSQAIDDNRIRNFMGKGTYQFSAVDKFSLMAQGNHKQRFHRRDPPYLFVEDQATRFQNQWAYNVLGQYNRVVGANGLFDIRFGRMWGETPYGYQAGVGPDDISIADTVRFTVVNSQFTEYFNPNHRYQFNVSYSLFEDWFNGNHDVKAGLQMSWERMFQESYRLQDYRLELADGIPSFAVLSNSPVTEEELTRTWAIFLQDNWTIGQRLTLNLGVRIDSINGIVPEQTSPAGTWIGERNQPRLDGLPGWTNVAPRLGFAYDLFGDSRTAIKGAYGRYYVQTGTLISQTLNRNGFSEVRPTWRDLDGNLRITPGPCGNITCSAELGTIPAFPTSNTTYDTSSKRPFDDEFSIGVDHSLTNNLAVSATYFHRRHPYGLGIINLARPSTAYTPVERQFTNPSGQVESVTVYSLDRALLTQSQRSITSSDVLNSSYNGFNVNVNKRFSDRWQILGGMTFSSNKGFYHTGILTDGNGFDLNNPNSYIGRENSAIFNDVPFQLNLAGSYLFPKDVLVALKYTASSGTPLLRQLSVRGLTQTETVYVAPRGEDRTEFVSQFVDVRLSKRFPIGNRARLEGIVDLFNILNANHVLNQNAAVGVSSGPDVAALSTSWGRPSLILTPRIIRLGVKLSF
ncbi:MAG TPA: TonB-dependent receptor [Vicinamibacteria bacterium]|nr:TonB-dependent receptor [Vicinamibacteria bacterium]